MKYLNLYQVIFSLLIGQKLEEDHNKTEEQEEEEFENNF